MRTISGIRRVVRLPAIKWPTPALGLALVWIYIPGRQGLAAPPQSTPPATSKQADQKSNQPGVWHHFGESPNPPSTAPRQSGTWHHFGEGVNPPPSPHVLPASRNQGLNHARAMEQQMLELMNRDRADPANTTETKGRALPLQWNESLAEVARAHSLDMLNKRYFAHEDGMGRNVANRVEAAGLAWQSVGENIAIYNSVASAEAAFMNEPRFTKNHRANILSAGFTEVGIGIVQAPNGSLYITQDFYTASSHASAR
jgi:uncharacterized protein YkwD